MRKARILAIICTILGILLIITFATYQYQVSPVDKSSKADIEVIIENGMSTDEIASLLEEKGLIRNSFFFKVYLRLNNVSSLKASTYLLQKNMSLAEIASTLETGSTYNPDAIRITFPEGQRITHYATILEENTNISAEAFLAKMKDQTYLQTLIANYWFLTEDILDSNIYYGLEGYLAPDTYEFANKDVTIEEVVSALLDQEAINLEPYKTALSTTNIHDTLTLASIAELEGVTEEDRKLIVGVFQNRLAQNMNLGSDVTTYYAFSEEMDQDLTSSMFNTYNPYNTRSAQMAGQLPVGPICNPSVESVEASLYPTVSDNLYFVADKNGKIYYTKTRQEHEAKVEEIKEAGDWIW